ncbi:MAG: 30S ribosomal protein S17 [Candidatus Pacebacteria bacterium]|nr:30S ribosomal protein S17 [Candidatus Paceibacterota bacterium]
MENNKSEKKITSGKILKGEVVSNKMEKTLVVLVKRFVKHPKYDKYRTLSKRHKAHYDEGEYNLGDIVVIQECNPISKDKRFKVVKS